MNNRDALKFASEELRGNINFMLCLAQVKDKHGVDDSILKDATDKLKDTCELLWF